MRNVKRVLFFSSRRRHTRWPRDWSSDVCSSDLLVRRGEGTMALGGSVVDGKLSGPGEVRGASIKSGSKQRVVAGDLLYVPPNMPHQFVAAPGKQFDVFVLKLSVKR